MTNIYTSHPRLIFRDTIQSCLIGPGSDVFDSDPSFELISDFPLKRYYSGVLFPLRVNKKESVGKQHEILSRAEFSDDDLNDPGQDYSGDAGTEKQLSEERLGVEPAVENATVDYADANHYFPTNFGLTFCVADSTKSIEAEFSFAQYFQVEDPRMARIEISFEDYEKLIYNPTFSMKEYLGFENGKMFFTKLDADLPDGTKERLTVYNLAKKFNEQPDIRNSTALHKAELLLGRVWRRVQVGPIKKTIELTGRPEDQSVGMEVFKNDGNSHIVSCYYKKVYQTRYGKYVKILMANLASQPKHKFSNTNEALNEKCLFQVSIKVLGAVFRPYKPLHERNPFDQELNTINYQYRNENAFAIGHGCAVEWNDPQAPTILNTTFLPEVDIKNFSNALRADFPESLKPILNIKQLSIWTTYQKPEVIAHLKAFSEQYLQWIQKQENDIPVSRDQQQIFNALIGNQRKTYERLIKNIDFLNGNEKAYDAFLLANTAMFIQMIISNDEAYGKKSKEIGDFQTKDPATYRDLRFFENYKTYSPAYYPFQLAFLLLNIESTINTNSADRNNAVDLLWFPTGGGKTEAYLALTAFTIFSRRMLHAESSKGVSVIMRYTLRLLTAQQFERASKLVLAMDFLRGCLLNDARYSTGSRAISIGMWVGSATTPNTYQDAKAVFTEIQNSLAFINQGKASDVHRKNNFPVTVCPWCGCKLISRLPATQFMVQGYVASYNKTTNAGSFNVHCLNEKCAFHSELPIYFVDDAIYEKQPELLFATVDKFAMLPHRKEGHQLFNSLNKNGLPPDLIIQDELHLLSGPLGSITGLFESMIELLCTKNGRKPKIVASTATTRNTASQVEMLYGNRQLNIFPPPGIDYDDNFFSYVSAESKRKHIGFIPTGKTGLDTQIQIVAHLLLARIQLFMHLVSKSSGLTRAEAIEKEDYYWTIVSFYNSLKDVGRVYNKIPAEILTLLKILHNRFSIPSPFFGFNHWGLTNRTRELTSRVESNLIKSLLNELEQRFSLTDNVQENIYVDKTVDLVLASNMFSVGIDIKRLNVMLMNGQPRNVAEYIQASSRVGRDKEGIVINLLDPNRSREKSYFEHFVPFNNAYYRFVEPLSVTPYTEITFDKVLNSLLICYVRHKKGLFEDKSAKGFDGNIEELTTFLSQRIKNHDQLHYALQKLDILKEQWLLKIQELDLRFKGAENKNFNLIQKTNDVDNWSLMQSMREIDTNSLIKIFINQN